MVAINSRLLYDISWLRRIARLVADHHGGGWVTHQYLRFCNAVPTGQILSLVPLPKYRTKIIYIG